VCRDLIRKCILIVSMRKQRILQNVNVFSKISKESTSFYHIHEKYSVSSIFLYNGNSKCYVVKILYAISTMEFFSCSRLPFNSNHLMYVIVRSAVTDSQNILTIGMKLRIIFLLHNTSSSRCTGR
jgi:hypothetical protein